MSLELPSLSLHAGIQVYDMGRRGTERPRLLVGTLPYHGIWKVWADWSEFGKIRGNITTANKTLLLEQSMPLYADYSEESWEPNWRRLIKWEEPLEQLFQMRNIWYESRNRDAAVQLQDAILFNVAKVVLRFPGLMKEPSDEEDVEGRILFDPSRDSFSRRPFDDRESSSPHSPYSGAHAMLKSRSHP